MVKVKFNLDYFNYRKGDVKEFGKGMVKEFTRRGIVTEIEEPLTVEPVVEVKRKRGRPPIEKESSND